MSTKHRCVVIFLTTLATWVLIHHSSYTALHSLSTLSAPHGKKLSYDNNFCENSFGIGIKQSWFRYSPQWSDCKIQGSRIYVNTSILEHLRMLPTSSHNFVDLYLGSQLPYTLTLVTAVSSNHFNELKGAVVSIQKMLQNSTMIVYDLGLEPTQIETIKKWCNVVYRKFNFTIYPQYVQNLYEYRWKPLIIKEVVEEFRAVMWLDSSVRITNKSAFHQVWDAAKRTGIALFRPRTKFATAAQTMPKTYAYLPTNLTQSSYIAMTQTVAIYYNTRSISGHVLKWYALCALEKDCMAPAKSRLHCQVTALRKHSQIVTDFCNCHRFDQSVINIILQNYFNFNDDLYTAGNSTCGWCSENAILISRGDYNPKYNKIINICQI